MMSEENVLADPMMNPCSTWSAMKAASYSLALKTFSTSLTSCTPDVLLLEFVLELKPEVEVGVGVGEDREEDEDEEKERKFGAERRASNFLVASLRCLRSVRRRAYKDPSRSLA